MNNGTSGGVVATLRDIARDLSIYCPGADDARHEEMLAAIRTVEAMARAADKIRLRYEGDMPVIHGFAELHKTLAAFHGQSALGPATPAGGGDDLDAFQDAMEDAHGYRPQRWATGDLMNARDADRYEGWKLARLASSPAMVGWQPDFTDDEVNECFDHLKEKGPRLIPDEAIEEMRSHLLEAAAPAQEAGR